MKYEELINQAMQIILHAGDARNDVQEALIAFRDQDLDKVEYLFKQANEKLQLAHSIQTTILQDEARGVQNPSSLLFNHAMDTMMTVTSELNMAKNMIMLLESRG